MRCKARIQLGSCGTTALISLRSILAPSSRGLGYRNLTPGTWIRIPLAPPYIRSIRLGDKDNRFSPGEQQFESAIERHFQSILPRYFGNEEYADVGQRLASGLSIRSRKSHEGSSPFVGANFGPVAQLDRAPACHAGGFAGSSPVWSASIWPCSLVAATTASRAVNRSSILRRAANFQYGCSSAGRAPRYERGGFVGSNPSSRTKFNTGEYKGSRGQAFTLVGISR